MTELPTPGVILASATQPEMQDQMNQSQSMMGIRSSDKFISGINLKVRRTSQVDVKKKHQNEYGLDEESKTKMLPYLKKGDGQKYQNLKRLESLALSSDNWSRKLKQELLDDSVQNLPSLGGAVDLL